MNDPDVPGGVAREVTVRKAGLNSWSAGVNWPISQPIDKGETVLLAYWAKGISAQNESQTPVISPVRIQQSAEPYHSAADGAAYLSRGWQLYYASGVANDRIDPGGAGIAFHMGLTPQTLRLGPAYVFNLGQGVDPRDLPQTKLRYDGQDADAPWRAKALSDIDRLRKTDITVTVLDRSGEPIAGQAVKVEMQKHDFHFGTFVNHKFMAPKTSTEKRWHKIFNENFNTATLPLYWADWGWTGNNRQQYKDTIKYTVSQDIPWRGHPIIWPGAFQMPTPLLEMKSPAAQRKYVLDHVRDVMGFIAPYKPMVVDMVNEPRVNQYFKENGNPELIEDAFRLAHEIAPEVPLFVNDYAILNNGGLNQPAIQYYHDWIKTMRAKNVPVGGIGFQAHFSAGLTPPQRVREILSGFGEYGLPLHITEFDVETLDEDTQADYTRDIVIAALAEPQMEAFMMWGFYEGSHWKPNAAMVRKDWSKKPNYAAWRKAVFETLWTDETLVTDSNGQVRLRGFKGEYVISAGGKTERANITAPSQITLQ